MNLGSVGLGETENRQNSMLTTHVKEENNTWEVRKELSDRELEFCIGWLGKASWRR